MKDRAVQTPRSIVLAEGSDPRIIEAAIRAQNDGIANITLLGNIKELRSQLHLADGVSAQINLLDPASENTAYTQAYFERRKHKDISLDDARAALHDPLNYANIMLQCGDVDGTVAGATHTTGDVVRSALQIIGTHPDYSLVSSLFIMIMPEDLEPLKGGVIYSDCGLVIDPNAAQLADIAAAAADNGRILLGLSPKVAMLSFSTKGSAKHASADKPREAAELLKSARPDLCVDGEMQFDAAIMPNIAKSKAPTSDVAGHANVFIFPDLSSGNIAYKITERLAGAKAIGPILQGLNKPANDLSRGCSADDVYNMIIVTVLQAQANEEMKSHG